MHPLQLPAFFILWYIQVLNQHLLLYNTNAQILFFRCRGKVERLYSYTNCQKREKVIRYCPCGQKVRYCNTITIISNQKISTALNYIVMHYFFNPWILLFFIQRWDKGHTVGESGIWIPKAWKWVHPGKCHCNHNWYFHKTCERYAFNYFQPYTNHDSYNLS